MFDIAFSELIVIVLVALLVVGPERLPALARKAGLLWAGLRRYASRILETINRDIALEEVRGLKRDPEQQTAAAAPALEERMRLLEQEALRIERKLHEDGLTLEEHILRAHHRQPDVNSASPPAPDASAK